MKKIIKTIKFHFIENYQDIRFTVITAGSSADTEKNIWKSTCQWKTRQLSRYDTFWGRLLNNIPNKCCITQHGTKSKQWCRFRWSFPLCLMVFVHWIEALSTNKKKRKKHLNRKVNLYFFYSHCKVQHAKLWYLLSKQHNTISFRREHCSFRDILVQIQSEQIKLCSRFPLQLLCLIQNCLVQL